MKTWHIGNSRAKLDQAVKVLGALALKEADDYELVLRKATYQRSKKQNARYWAIVNEIAEQLAPEGKKYSGRTWHKYFRGRFLGWIEERWPNGKTFEDPVSTTTLDVAEFNEYMTQIEVWAAEHGVLLHDVGEPA